MSAAKAIAKGRTGFLIALCAALYPILSYLKARLDPPPEATPHPSPLPAGGEREGPAQREGEGQYATKLGLSERR